MSCLRTLIKEAAERFGAAGIECAGKDAELLAFSCFNCDRLFLLLRGDEELADPDGERRFAAAAEKRLSGMPVQYITNSAAFMGMDLYVDENVLIPRPETEILADMANKEIASYAKGEPVRMLDLCTGSGCIALAAAMSARLRSRSLPYEYLGNSETLKIVAGDISAQALDVARRNARSYGLESVDFRQGDLYGILGDGSDAVFDIIVSNPPYIPTGLIPGLQKEVSCFEPQLALDGGCDGLDVIRRIISDASLHLRPGGILLMEIGCDQAERASELALGSGLSDVHIIKDLSGLDRILQARRK